MSFFGTAAGRGPVMSWESPHTYPAINGYTIYEKVTFANFGEKCGKRDFAIGTNDHVGDILHPVSVKGKKTKDQYFKKTHNTFKF